MYKAQEFRQGRVFQVTCEPGDDVVAELAQFVRDKDIRFGSVFLLGALAETGMISGFNSQQGYDVARHHFADWRELVAYGTISWPDQPPAALGAGLAWPEPQPYVHIHMALSGGPGKTDEVLAGHLSRGIVKGGMMAQVYELAAVG